MRNTWIANLKAYIFDTMQNGMLFGVDQPYWPKIQNKHQTNRTKIDTYCKKKIIAEEKFLRENN